MILPRRAINVCLYLTHMHKFYLIPIGACSCRKLRRVLYSHSYSACFTEVTAWAVHTCSSSSDFIIPLEQEEQSHPDTQSTKCSQREEAKGLRERRKPTESGLNNFDPLPKPLGFSLQLTAAAPSPFWMSLNSSVISSWPLNSPMWSSHSSAVVAAAVAPAKYPKPIRTEATMSCKFKDTLMEITYES